MRIKRTIKNSVIALCSYLFLLVIGIGTRKAFLSVFPIEYLGYEGLFSSIFTLLSIAELGASGMFNYMLYAALASNDENELSVIMGMYRTLYRIVGCIVFSIGCILFFFLDYIITENVTDWRYVRIIYIIQLSTTLVSYFLAYRRAIFVANQESYEVVKVDTIYGMFGAVARLLIVLLLRNYILYLVVPLVVNIFSNIHIYIKCKNKYSNIFGYNASIKDFEERGAIKQLKSLLLSKISTVLYTSADNIIISRMIGIGTVGLYSNYTQIYNFGVSAIWKLVGPFNESTGNLINTESEQNSNYFFKAYDFLGYITGTIGWSVIVCCFQKVIAFIYGDRFLLPIAAVVALGADFYVRLRGAAYNSFQNAIGHYEIIKWYGLIGAMLNISLSIMLGIKYGLAGILAATVIANIIIQSGRAHVVYKFLYRDCIKQVIKKELVFAIISGITVLVSYGITVNMNDIAGLLFSMIFSIIVPGVIIMIVFWKSDWMQSFRNYLRTTIYIVKGYIKKQD